MVWVEFRHKKHHIKPIKQVNDRLYYKMKNIYYFAKSKHLGPRYWYILAVKNSKDKWVYRAMVTTESYAKQWIEKV